MINNTGKYDTYGNKKSGQKQATAQFCLGIIIRRELMTVILLLGDKNKGWCEDCMLGLFSLFKRWFSDRNLANFKLALGRKGSCSLPPFSYVYMFNLVLGDLYAALSCHPSFWEASPGGLWLDYHTVLCNTEHKIYYSNNPPGWCRRHISWGNTKLVFVANGGNLLYLGN